MSSSQPKSNNSLAVRINRWALSLSRHWLRVMLILVGIYVGTPFLAPVFMHLGWTSPAYYIYDAYGFTCHQFAFRSWFLFGEQPAYPRAQANVAGLQPYEAYASDINAGNANPVNVNLWSYDLEIASRNFIGDARMGYKVAICERDVAIYGAFFIGGLIYAIPYVRRRLRPVPLWLYIFLGLFPIGIDGFSQLFSNPPISLWPPRESTPLFRTVTGALFGLMNAWLAFPHLETSARETMLQIQDKFRRREERQAES